MLHRAGHVMIQSSAVTCY